MSKTTPSGSRRFALTAVASAALIVTAACNRAADQPKVPLAQATSGTASGQPNPHDQLAPEVRVALDSGNLAFRAGKYDVALEQYRMAARQEKKSAAPYYGIYMVAEKQGNKKLADSVMTVIRERSAGTASLLTDTSMAKMHNVEKGKPTS